MTASPDKDTIIERLQQGKAALSLRTAEQRQDKDIVLAAVQQDGWALQFAHTSLKADKDIVLAAVQQDGWALQFAHKNLQADKDIVMAAVQQYGRALLFAHKSLRGNPDVVIAAFKGMLARNNMGDDTSVLGIDVALLQSPKFAGRCVEEGLDVEAIAAVSGDFTLGLTVWYAQQNTCPGLLHLHHAQHDGTAAPHSRTQQKTQ